MGLLFRRGHELVNEELNITRIVRATRTSHVMKSHLSELSTEHKKELERAPIRHITLKSSPSPIWTLTEVTERDPEPEIDPEPERESKPLLEETVSVPQGPTVDIKEEVVIAMDDNFDPEDPARVIEKARAVDEKIRHDRTR